MVLLLDELVKCGMMMMILEFPDAWGFWVISKKGMHHLATPYLPPGTKCRSMALCILDVQWVGNFVWGQFGVWKSGVVLYWIWC